MSIRNLMTVTGLPFNVPPIVDITDQLPKNGSWETLKGKQNIVRGVWDKTYHTGLRRPEDIDTIVIHHSGPPEGSLEAHARYHASQWGAGISYHISIDQGLIKQLNDLLSFTFHVSGNNTYTVGIEINADLSKRDMTPTERNLLYAAILSVKAVLPIKYILGHNELNNTSCPCTSMDLIRQDVKNIEMSMQVDETWESKVKKVNQIANQYTWMTGLMKPGPTDGNAQWAVNELLKVREIMIQQKLLNP